MSDLRKALEPCPSCGKPPGSRVGPPTLVRCVTDGCLGRDLAAETPAEWNTRAATKQSRPGNAGAVAWQILDKQGRWITLPGDWNESENLEGREYRPLYATPPAAAGREEIAKAIMESGNCGIGAYDKAGKWMRIFCNDDSLKDDPHHYFADCDCSKACDAVLALGIPSASAASSDVVPAPEPEPDAGGATLSPHELCPWQPIETAPTKDETEIWAFNGEQARMVWLQDEGLWLWADELLCDADPDPEQPTHWMPLPADPPLPRAERGIGS